MTPDVYTVLRGCRLYPDLHLGHSIMYVVVFMAAQSSKDGRQEVLPKALMRVGIPKKVRPRRHRIPSVFNSPGGRRAGGE